jgi:hypothetical protein
VCHCTSKSRHFEGYSHSEDEGNTVLYTYENYSPHNTGPNHSKLKYSPHKTSAMTLTLDLRYASTTDTVLIKGLLKPYQREDNAKCTSQKYDTRAWAGFIWLRTGTCGALL